MMAMIAPSAFEPSKGTRWSGVGLKPEHFRTVLETCPDVGFFEVHAENYMVSGGPALRYLSAIRERYDLSLHGVGLSIGSDRPLDLEHIARIKKLIDRFAPLFFSEHLAWSSHDGAFLNDLLPLPYTTRTLRCVCEHIDQVQAALGRKILLENPSTYLQFSESTYSEVDFLAEIVARTGCGLLLDVNNAYVSARNQQFDPFVYIEASALAHAEEIHLAGHAGDRDEAGRAILIDTHDREVDELVWGLFAAVIRKTGPVPTLIEWDAEVPAWSTLKAQADRAEAVMRSMSNDNLRRQPQLLARLHRALEVTAST